MPEHITNELEIYIDERNCNKEKYQDLSEEEKKVKKVLKKISKFYWRRIRKKSVSIVPKLTRVFLRNKSRS